MTNRFITKPNKTLEEIGGINANNRAQAEYNKEVNKVFNDDTWNEGLDGIIDKFTIPVAVPEEFRGNERVFDVWAIVRADDEKQVEVCFLSEKAARHELLQACEEDPFDISTFYSVKLISGNVHMYEEAEANEQAYMNYISSL